MTKTRSFIIFAFLLVLSLHASPMPVTMILKDDARVDNSTVIHSLAAFEDLQNVTIIDYFSSVSPPGVTREKFLGREWNAVKMEIGNLRRGENRTIAYKILTGRGEAMLGADVYYLNGEKHQLFPIKTTTDLETTADAGEQGMGWVAPLFLPFIVVLAFVMYLKFRRRL